MWVRIETELTFFIFGRYLQKENAGYGAVNNLRQFFISNPLSIFPPCKGRGVLHKHSKAYVKRERNNCKGETQHIPIKRIGVLHYLLFTLCINLCILSPFHLFTFSPFHLFTFHLFTFHLFTFSPFHPFTFSPFTFSPFHFFTLSPLSGGCNNKQMWKMLGQRVFSYH